MTRTELIDALSERRDLPRLTAEEVVAAVLDEMADRMAEGARVELRGFGSFQVRQYDAYTGRNPRTGEPIDVAAKRLPHFKPGKRLRTVVNGEAGGAG
jgi:integration host factor subunit beta